MAHDLFSGTDDGKDFARGDAPPPNSWEWVGSATPPTQAELDARKKPVVVHVRESMLIVESKPRRRLWPWLLGAGAFAGGVWYGQRR